MTKNNFITLKNVELNIPSNQGKDEFILPNLHKLFYKKNYSGIIRKIKKGADQINLLRNINIEIKKGERIALIGRNGAGKTTFLRLISGIYHPSKGILKRNVYVHPVIYKGFLTSNELNGYKAAKAHYLLINRNLKGFKNYIEQVKNFSELGDYFYKPVKIYSEGMQTRLLFSIITGFKHECLAMDEGLSAGDKNFINKAQQRLDSFIGKSGTLILASHSDDLLKQFCKRGLVFDSGEIKYDGDLEAALKFYDSM